VPLRLTHPEALAAEGMFPSEAEWTFLPLSACRHAVRTLSFPTQVRVGIWLVVSEDFDKREAKPQGLKPRQFLLPYGTAEAVPLHKPLHWRMVQFTEPLLVLAIVACQSFLLIICTRHIFTRTACCGTAEAVPFPKHFDIKSICSWSDVPWKSVSRSAGYSDLPAYSQILLRLAITNLRTVIVTAAVHWGFSSKLRLAANLSL
jgi:hypothetical protein